MVYYPFLFAIYNTVRWLVLNYVIYMYILSDFPFNEKKSVENLKTLVLSCKDVNNHSLTDFVILEFAYSAYVRKYFVNFKVVLLCLSINVYFLN